MAARIPLENMTLRQIAALESQLAAAKSKATEAAKAEVKTKIDALLASSGLTISDLYPAVTHSRRRSKSSPKYANPDDRTQTWTGRGRQPNWLVARLKKGAKVEDFSI
jgi:DNA-binding protein H-NS